MPHDGRSKHVQESSGPFRFGRDSADSTRQWFRPRDDRQRLYVPFLDPPLVLVCIRKGNRCYEMIENAGTFAVNILAQEQDLFSNRFAGGLIDSDGEWKAWPEGQSTFDDLQITRGKHSAAPLLPECLAHLECSLEAVHSGGDHGIFIGRVVAIHVNDETSDPLLYFAGQYGRFQGS